jgi:uncharacterized protein
MVSPGRARGLLTGAFVALVAVAAARGAQAETPIPEPPARWLTDRAGFVSPGTAATLDERLARYEASTGHQVLVYVDRTTGGVPIEDWAVKAFERWRVGRRGLDDGVVLFIFSEDRRLRIEVGYGLEGQLPDLRAARIINERIVPKIRAGDRDGAVTAGVEAITTALGTPPAPEDLVGEQPAPQLSKWHLLAAGLALLLFLGFAITHPRLAWLMLLTIGSGRGGGGGWGGGGWGGGGGGGFSGGGGRSGGGGASGSW